MAKWKVFKYVKTNGRCPIDEWYDSRKLTKKDRAALDARVDRIQGVEGRLLPEWLKKYKTSTVHEMKAKGDNQLRPLCTVTDCKRIIMLIGVIKKAKNLPPREVKTAERLKVEVDNGNGSVRKYE